MKKYAKTHNDPLYLLASRGLDRPNLAVFNNIVEQMEALGIYSPGDNFNIRILVDALRAYNAARDEVEQNGVAVESTTAKGTCVKNSQHLNALHRSASLITKVSSELGLTTMARKKLNILMQKKEQSIAEILNGGTDNE